MADRYRIKELSIGAATDEKRDRYDKIETPFRNRQLLVLGETDFKSLEDLKKFLHAVIDLITE
jgi:hypothetical protein